MARLPLRETLRTLVADPWWFAARNWPRLALICTFTLCPALPGSVMDTPLRATVPPRACNFAGAVMERSWPAELPPVVRLAWLLVAPEVVAGAALALLGTLLLLTLSDAPPAVLLLVGAGAILKVTGLLLTAL